MISTHLFGRRAPARYRAALAALTAAAAIAAAAPSAAHAGTYPSYACDVPGINLPAPTKGAWTNYDSSGHIQHWDSCGSQSGRGGASWFQINYPYGVLAQNTGVGVELQIPASGPLSAISIDRVIDWTTTQLTAQGAGQAPAYGLNTAGSISSAPGGDTSGFDGIGTTGAGHDSGPLAANAKNHRIGVYCAYMGGGYGNCTLPSPFLRVRGLKATLKEGVQPSGSIDGGSITFDGPLKGTKTLSYTGSDGESGIERVVATLDGIIVASKSFARDLTQPVAQQIGECDYVGLRACPASASDTLSVNTASVPDGSYELGLRVTDAAGNTRTTVANAPVVIDNVVDAPAPVGPTPIVVPGQNGQNGADGKDGGVLTVNGVNASPSASLRAAFASSRRGVIKSTYGKKVLITGQLLAPGGQPITGARLSVMQQEKMLGATMAPAGQVTTDRQGKFRYVTTARRSTTVRFGYRTHLQDTDFSETTDISLGVIAKVALTPNKRSLRNGQTVRFLGTLAGAPRGSRKVVELQVKKGRRWMTFRSTRLRNGRFDERYRFTQTHGTKTYAFRARVREEAGFPFLTGASKQVRVKVRG